MKKIIVTCAMLTVGTMVSFAQDVKTNAAPIATAPAPAMQAKPTPMTNEQRAERFSKRDETMFQLTPEQSKKVYDVELEFVSAMEKFRAENKQPNPADREAIMSKKDAKMKVILTPEQYKKYDMSRNRQRNAPMAPGAPTPMQQPGNAPQQAK